MNAGLEAAIGDLVLVVLILGQKFLEAVDEDFLGALDHEATLKATDIPSEGDASRFVELLDTEKPKRTNTKRKAKSDEEAMD